jgi:hypothetical protein
MPSFNMNVGGFLPMNPGESAKDYAKRLSASVQPGAATQADATGTSQSQQLSNEWASSGQQFADPQAALGAGADVNRLISTLAPAYQQFLQDPTQHNLIQQAIPGMLAANEPMFRSQMRDLADAGRLSGNTASSAYQKEAGKLAAGQYATELGQISNLVSTLYPQIAQSMYNPIGMSDELVNALKMGFRESSGSSTGTASSSTPYFAPQSGGGGISPGPVSTIPRENITVPNSPGYSRSSPNPTFTGQTTLTTVPSNDYGSPFYANTTMPKPGEEW